MVGRMFTPSSADAGTVNWVFWADAVELIEAVATALLLKPSDGADEVDAS